MLQTIGQRMSYLMKERNVTNIEMAEVLDISASYIAKFKTDARRPNSFQLEQIAHKLNVSTDYLLGNDAFDIPFYSNLLDENTKRGINFMSALNGIKNFAIENQWNTIKGLEKGDILIFQRMDSNNMDNITYNKIYILSYKGKELCVGRINNSMLYFDNGMPPISIDGDDKVIKGKLVRVERYMN